VRSAVRTCAAAAPGAAVIAFAWLRLERPESGLWRGAALAGLAVAVGLVPRAWWRAAAGASATVFAVWVAFGVSLLPPSPLDPGAGFGLGAPFHAAWERFVNGFLAFYSVPLPFDAGLHAGMESVVLGAVFAFVLLLVVLAAARRTLAAAVVLVVGAGWPATLFDPARGVVVGTAILVAGLALLAGLGARRVPLLAAPASVAVALVALGIGSATAAGRALVHWESWDPAGAPATPVDLSFVWDAQYLGLDWPKKQTVVLEVRTRRRPRYLRVAVLDDFSEDAWRLGAARPADALEPPAAVRPRNETPEHVTVEALAGTRLAGGSIPIRFTAGTALLDAPASGFALVPFGLTPGFRYTAWSWTPQVSAAELRSSPPDYPAELVTGGMLGVGDGLSAPGFGAPERAARLGRLFARNRALDPYRPLARLAEQVGGRAGTPYGAVVDLERWFRVTGGFGYSDHPPVIDPPLVGFVTRTRAGYCQYFAGAMALMLRYLGVPARVAVGFSGGTYDAKNGVWDVTDHDAHAWVEAWFRGYGWLPFDPTPAVPGSALAQSLPVSSASPATPGVSGRLPRGGTATPRTGKTTRNAAPALGRHGLGRAAAGGGGPEPAPGVGAPLVLVILLAVVGAIVGGIAATKLAVKLPGRRAGDPRRVAAACREELVAFLVDQQLDAAGGATLQELGQVARRHLAIEPEAFVAAATVARFAPAERAGPAAREARRELRALLADARRSLSRRERFLGLLSLRSLLGARATVDASASLEGAGS